MRTERKGFVIHKNCASAPLREKMHAKAQGRNLVGGLHDRSAAKKEASVQKKRRFLAYKNLCNLPSGSRRQTGLCYSVYFVAKKFAILITFMDRPKQQSYCCPIIIT